MENLLVGYFRTFHNATARTFVPTAALRDEMSAAGFRNLAVVGRGVDTQLFDPLKRSAELRRHWGAASGTCVFLYVGRLAAEKNMGVLFESVQRAKAMAPDTKLVVVGDGPLRKALQRCHPEAIFLGLRQGEELARVYASCDAFLFPSRTDTFGNVVMEAMASGLLLVAFDSGAAHEHVFSRPFATPSSLPSPASDDDFIDVACQLVLHPYRFRGLRQDMRSRALATGWDEVLNGFNRQLEDVADSMSAAHGTSPVDT